jgi:hypothetical protein
MLFPVNNNPFQALAKDGRHQPGSAAFFIADSQHAFRSRTL